MQAKYILHDTFSILRFDEKQVMFIHSVKNEIANIKIKVLDINIYNPWCYIIYKCSDLYYYENDSHLVYFMIMNFRIMK